MYLSALIIFNLFFLLSLSERNDFPDNDCNDTNELTVNTTELTVNITELTVNVTEFTDPTESADAVFLNDNFRSNTIIKQINNNYAYSWKAKRNFPRNTSVAYLKTLGGGVRYIKDETRSSGEITEVHHTLIEVPREFDARTKWPHCESIQTIRNQGKCGSCWAVQTASTISDRICIQSKGKVNVFISTEDILSCCKFCTSGNNGCEGGDPGKVWIFWIEEGIVSGGDVNTNVGCKPYSEESFQKKRSPDCIFNCTNRIRHFGYSQDKHMGTTFYKVSQGVTQMQIEIMTNGPVVGHIHIYEDIFLYKKGVYQHVTGSYMDVIHAIKILGWGEENGVPYWWVANSWGTDFGNLGGFMKILRGENHCGIESDIITGAPRGSGGFYQQTFIFLGSVFFLSFLQ